MILAKQVSHINNQQNWNKKLGPISNLGDFQNILKHTIEDQKTKEYQETHEQSIDTKPSILSPRTLPDIKKKEILVASNDKTALDEIKLPVTDSRLNEFKKYLFYAQQAYCLSNEYNLYQGIHAKLEKVDGELIVYFKGPVITKEKWEKRINVLVDYPYEVKATVDGIFLGQFVQLGQILLVKILSFFRYNPTYHQVRLIGHDIGGVHAILTALAIEKFNMNLEITVYTLGQPRIGNKQFSHYVNKKIKVYRITRSGDNISQYPQPSDIYSHHEREHWILPGDCDCNTPDLVFECRGKKSSDSNNGQEYFNEPTLCNKQAFNKNPFSDVEHWGPYFGYYMICPDISKSIHMLSRNS